MKSLIVAMLALLLTAGVASAAGLRMGPNDIKDNEKAGSLLAGRISEALARDPSGNGVIAGHPCSTPNHYFNAIRSYHPNASLGSVGELPNYLRQLKYESHGPSGSFPMSRILQSGNTCTLDLKGWSRSFHTGEGAWHDPSTGDTILAGDCDNVVGGTAPPPPPRKVSDCVEIPAAVVEAFNQKQTVQVEVRPTLLVWGPKIEGCGLKVVDCVCIDPVTGKAAIAYQAPSFIGSGMIRMPRELARRMDEICFKADGLGPVKGQFVSRELVISDIRPYANSDSQVILPPGKAIKFLR